MAEETKMDLTAKLPDEILKEVFQHLPSLRDKLRLESVSRRFQRCLIELLNTKPIPFNAQWEKLNQYHVPRDQLPGAIQSLAKKAKFSNINIDDEEFEENNGQCDRILTALVDTENGCMEKVSTFQINSFFLYGRCSPTPLKEVLAKCPKLSEVRLDFFVRPLNTEDDLNGILVYLPVTSSIMNLGVVLEGKALTGLDIHLHRYTQQQVMHLFRSIEPNVLKQLFLHLSKMTLEPDKLATELGGGPWAALEEMNIDFNDCANLRMDILFSSHFFAHLPAVRKCNFSFERMDPHTQLVAALRSLFTNEIEINVSVFNPVVFPLTSHHETGCQIVARIRQVQAVYPDLHVDFGPDGNNLRLTLDKVSFEQDLHATVPTCNDNNCNGCAIFYPALITSIRLRADQRVAGTQQDVHLVNGRLDRCRVDTIVAHLNRDVFHTFLMFGRHWTALQVEMNEGHNLATITFETEEEEEAEQHNQFQITVDCGHCLENACFGCLNVG